MLYTGIMLAYQNAYLYIVLILIFDGFIVNFTVNLSYIECGMHVTMRVTL